ncbi:MAG: hypothetical protein P0111_05335 [Nitrospira sp.]|nr:hypothetical protein [Nitrospira sp.]
MAPQPDRSLQDRGAERGAAVALLPIVATVAFYSLSSRLQDQPPVQLIPQLLGYLACLLWAARNPRLVASFGLEPAKLAAGVLRGLPVGCLLGAFNSFVILWCVPRTGYDITFLTQTPHARLPAYLMLPWLICGIALFVEFNFRGFLLGRLQSLGSTTFGAGHPRLGSSLAVGLSALTFSFDPFMTHTFRELHWIALWDGAIWGALQVATRNLYVPITAHAVEVLVMYSVIRSVLLG